MAALAGIGPLAPELLAHGGAGGLIVEILVAVAVLAVFLAVYLRERRANREDEPTKVL